MCIANHYSRINEAVVYHRGQIAYQVEIVSMSALGRLLILCSLCASIWPHKSSAEDTAPLHYRLTGFETDRTCCVCVSDRLLFTANTAGFVCLSRPNDNRVVARVKLHEVGPDASCDNDCMAISSDARILATVDRRGLISLIKVMSDRSHDHYEMIKWRSFSSAFRVPVANLAFGKDNETLFGLQAGFTTIWRLENNQTIIDNQAPNDKGEPIFPALAIAISRDKKYLAEGYPGGKVRILNAVDRTLVSSLHAPRLNRGDLISFRNCVAFSPVANIVAAFGSWDNVVLWDLSERRLVREIKTSIMYECVAFSPDGGRLAAGSNEGVVTVWHINSGRQVLSVQVGPKAVLGGADPKGRVKSIGFLDDKTIFALTGEGKLFIVFTTTKQYALNEYRGMHRALDIAPAAAEDRTHRTRP